MTEANQHPLALPLFERRGFLQSATALATLLPGEVAAQVRGAARSGQAVSINASAAGDAAAAFDRAKAQCKASGARRITFAPGTYRTSRTMVNDLPGLSVEGNGATIVLAVQGPSAFELCADGGRVTGFHIVGDFKRVVARHTHDSYRTDAGVACYNCHHYEISAISVRNCQAGIYASGWRTGGPDGHGTGVFQTDGVIRDVSFDTCDFGLIYGVQDRLLVQNLDCRNTTKILGYEPHAIYATNAYGVERVDKAESNQAGSGGSGYVRVINANSDSNHYDSCFKFKAHKRLVVSGLHGRDSRILVQFIGCPDLQASNLTLSGQRKWVNDTGKDVVWLDASGKRRQSTEAGETYAHTSQGIAVAYSDRAHLTNLTIDQADGYSGVGLKISFSSNVTIDGVTVHTRRTDRSGDHAITLNDGSNHAVFRNVTYIDAGNGDEEVFSFTDSSDGLVDQPRVSGSTRYGVLAGTASGNRLILPPGANPQGEFVWRTIGKGQGNTVSRSR